MFDYIVIGGGPGGIQAAYNLKQEGRKVLVLEKLSCAGAFFQKYPLHRTLISVNKVYSHHSRGSDITFRWDWNSLLTDEPENEKFLFSSLTNEYFANAGCMTEYCQKFTTRFNIQILTNEQVIRIHKIVEKQEFLVKTSSQEFRARKVIIATVNHKEFTPQIPGIDLTSNYVNISHKPEEYRNKRVLIIGKGNTGMETANMMIGTATCIHMISPSPVKFAWNSNFPGNVRAVNMTFLDSCLLSRDNLLRNGTVQRISRSEKATTLVAEISDQYRCSVDEYDEIINCTGFQFDVSIFDDSCKPELVHENRLPRMTNCFESTNVPGLYFAGALTSSRDFKMSSSAFIHGFRYNSRALARYLNLVDFRVPWPTSHIQWLDTTGNKFFYLAKAILRRAETSSGLWHLLGVLCDLFCLPLPGTKNRNVLHFQELPCGMLETTNFADHVNFSEYLVIQLSLDVKPQCASTTFVKKHMPHAKITIAPSKYVICAESAHLRLCCEENIHKLSVALAAALPTTINSKL